MTYTPGLMVGQLSGKAGSTVAARNRNGSYFRTRVSPVLVRNPRTEAVRASFTQNSQEFRNLTAAQIQAWNSLGGNITRSNSVGAPYTLTGLQAYQSVNRNLATIGQPAVSDPPQQSAPAAVVVNGVDAQAGSETPDTTVVAGAASATQNVADTSAMREGDWLWFVTAGVQRQISSITDSTHVVLAATVTTTTGEDVIINRNGQIIVDHDPATVPADTYFAIFATPPLSNGVNRPTKNAYKLIVVRAPAFSGTDDITAYYNDVCGVPPVNTKIFVQVVAISSTGFRATPAEGVATTYRPTP